jgi:hypothetical protein
MSEDYVPMKCVNASCVLYGATQLPNVRRFLEKYMLSPLCERCGAPLIPQESARVSNG